MATGDFEAAARSGDARQVPRRDRNRYVHLISVIGAIGGLLWGKTAETNADERDQRSGRR
jgi:hypothetical protein